MSAPFKIEEPIYQTSPLFFAGARHDTNSCWSSAANLSFNHITLRGAQLALAALQGQTESSLIAVGYSKEELMEAVEAGFLAVNPDTRGGSFLWEKRGWSRFAYLISTQLNYPYAENAAGLTEFVDAVEFRRNRLLKYESEQSQPLRGEFSNGLEIHLPKPTPIVLDWPAMFARRSVRNFSEQPVPISLLSSILWSSTAHARGARRSQQTIDSYFKLNSFYEWLEVFLLIENVSGLERGVYHYDLENHSLKIVSLSLATSDVVSAIQGQKWAEGGGFSIIAVADWHRYMWLYRLSRAYTNVLIQVGEFAQEVIQYGTSLGLSHCVTPAINEELGSQILNINDRRYDPIYYIRAGYKHRKQSGRANA